MKKTVDTYLRAKDLTSLEQIRESLVNVIKPKKGKKATLATKTKDGEAIPAQPALGDDKYYYTCIRAGFPIVAFDDVEVCTEEEAKGVVGVWA